MSKKRFEVPMSQAQYTALAESAETEGYSSVAEYVRQILALMIPSFKYAEALPERGKYLRESLAKCPYCGHEQMISSSDDECAQCGECEFIIEKRQADAE